VYKLNITRVSVQACVISLFCCFL